jgi:hypothetical protein
LDEDGGEVCASVFALISERSEQTSKKPTTTRGTP